MSEPDEWIRRGFEGPTAIAAAAKEVHEALMGTLLGAILPEAGQPPMLWDVDGERAIYAVWVRPDSGLAVPDGMREAAPWLVGRMIGG